MSYLEQLLQRVAKELGRPYEQDVLPFKQVLEKNWFDTEQAIQAMKDSDFDELKIPKRLAVKIKQAVGTRSVVQKQTTPEMQPEKPREIQHVRPYEDIFHNFLDSLKSQAMGSKDRIRQSVKVLSMIVNNVLKDPNQEKYRRVKHSNKKINQCISMFHSCIYLMEFIGFINTPEEFLLPSSVELEHLKTCATWLEKCQNQVGNFFDPYKTSLNTTSQGQSIDKIAQSEGSMVTEYSKMLDQLIEQRTKTMSNPPKDRAVRIYHKKYENKSAGTYETTFKDELEQSHDPVVREYWAKIINMNHNATFQSKKKAQFQAMLRQSVYDKTLIKIKLPNDYIIEGIFAPLEPIKNVVQFAQQYISGDIYIFTTPPPVQMSKHLNKTLTEMDCVPSGIFFLGCQSYWAIRNEYLPYVQN